MFKKINQSISKKFAILLVIAMAFFGTAVSVLLLKRDVQAFNGAGTESDPYVISTKSDLKLLQTNVDKGMNYIGNYFVLGKDIDMEGDSFNSIGSSIVSSFGGNLDGRNFFIKNLAVMKADVDESGAYNGLFGYLYAATISNVNVENIRFNVSAKSGENGTAGGVNLDGNNGNSAFTELYTGGIAGYAAYSTISNSYVDGTITVFGGNGGNGGLAGIRNVNGNGTNGGDGADAKDIYVGGIVGKAIDTHLIGNGFSGSIIGIGGSAGSGGDGGAYRNKTFTTGGKGGDAGISGNTYLGGIVGHIMDEDLGSTMNKNYSSSELYAKAGAGGNGGTAGTGRTIGGAGGANSIAGAIYSGGIVGYSYVSVENSFTEGNIEFQAEPKGIYGLTSTGTTPGPNGENATEIQEFIFGGIAGVMVGDNTTIKSSYTTMEATEKHDYGYFNDIHVRIGGMAGLIDASNVGIIDSVVLSRLFTAEVEEVDEGEMIRSIANFATYRTELQMQTSIQNSLRNKNIDMFLYTSSEGVGSEWLYKDGDENSSRAGQIQVLNNKPLVFEYLNPQDWTITANVNNGYPTMNGVNIKRFDYSKIVSINTLSDLKNLANRNNSGYSYYGQTIYINNDIEMSKSVAWEPIGKDFRTAFQGTVVGQNKNIKTLLVTKATDYKGLFGYTSRIEIKNLTILDPNFSSNSGSYVGAFLGYNLHDANLENLKVFQTGSTEGNNAVIKGNRIIGGVAGQLDGLKNSVDTVANTVNIVATNTPFVANETYVGGLFGLLGRTHLQKSYNVGNVTINTSTTAQHFAGGLVGGILSGQSMVENSFNVGNVSGGVNVAGLIGTIGLYGHGTIIDRVYAAGEIAATYAGATISYTSPLVSFAHFNVTMSNSVNALTKLTISSKQTPRYIGKLISFAVPSKIVSATATYTRDTFTNTNNYYNSNAVNTAVTGTGHANYYDVISQSIAKTFVEIATIDFFQNSARFDFDDIWESNPAINNGLPFFKGEGDELGFESQPGYGNNPIQIKTLSDLSAFRDEVNSGKKFIGQTISLANHINMGGENWVPIGINATNYFGGIFDGDNFTISGLMVDKTTAFTGLFGYAINATFKNLHISNPIIVEKAGADKGALLGRGTTNIVIDNVHVTDGYVKSTANNVGGIVGYIATGSRILNSSTTNVEVKGLTYVGGLIGYTYGTVNHTSVNISDSFSASHVKAAGNGAGGVTGYMRGGTIERVYTTGNVVAMNGYAGGIFGYSTGNAVTVTNVMTRGNIYSSRLSDTAIAGGVGGNVAVTSAFNNILVTGNIRAATSVSSTALSGSAGGIVGFGNIAGITINSSAVMSKEVIGVGELVRWNGSHPLGAGRDKGRPSGGGVFGSETNIYLDTMELGPIKGLTEAQLSTVVAAAKPESAFYDIGSYYSMGWSSSVIAQDGSAIWNIDSESNDGLPYLTKLGELVWPKGSIKDPHQISSKADLVKLATEVNAGNPFAGQYFDVVNSFEIGDWMTPIGTKFAEGFSGIFNGNYHTLSGLKNPANRAGIFGLFGALTQAEIKNLILSNVNITLTTASTGGDRVGAVAGQAYANTRMSNIAVTSGTVTSPAVQIGGLVGMGHSLTIDKSYSAATVKGGGRVGGLVGIQHAGKITRSYTTGNIFGTLGSNYGVGGLVGNIAGAVTIQDSYSKGNISDSSTSTFAIAGGIVGYINSKVAVMDRVYATGNITAHTTWTSTSSGNGAYAGGIVGMSNLAASSTGVRITNSVSYSNRVFASTVKAKTAQSTPGVGSNVTTVSRIATGENSWYLDTVERNIPKGIAGAASANPYMSPKTSEFLLEQTNLSSSTLDGGLGWDFEDVWSMKESVNGGFPYLVGLIPNRSDLEILLAQAQNYERSEWLDTTFDIFETKRQNAIAVYESNSATFEELDTAYIQLAAAIKNLRGDARELQTIYNQFYEDNTVTEIDETGQNKKIFLSYLFKNYGIVESALASAKIVLEEDSNAYNNSFINNSKNVLIAAIAGLIVDKTELQKLINEVNELKEENYDILVWMELDKARAQALKVNNNDGIIAGTKDIYFAIKAIKLAMGDLVLDIQYLQNLIAQAEGYIQGISASKFTSVSYNAYVQAIANAKLITNESSVELLNQAVFDLSVELTNLTVDKSTLQINIALADNKNSNHFTSQSYSNLISSLSNAKTFAALPRPKLAELQTYISQLDDVNSALETALDNLVINTQLLQDVIAQAKLEQNDDLIYTVESWQVLQDAIAEAELVVETQLDTITGEALTELIDKVKHAILSLEINKTYLIDLIATAKTIKKGYYDDTTYSNLQTAIAAGEDLLISTEINIDDVRSTMALIRQSIVALKIDIQIIQNFIERMENQFKEDYINPTDWSSESYTILTTVKEDAKTILSNEYDNTILLNIINRIENALSDLVPDKRELDILINELSSWVNTKYRQDNDGNFILDDNGNLKQFLVYSAGTWRNLQDAIALAKITQHSNVTTKEEIETEIYNLNFAVESLRVDVSELEYRITHAENLLLEIMKYTADSLAELKVSKENAEESLLNDKLTLEQLQVVLDDLVSKINNLVVDRSSIIQLIEQANALLRINYTEATWVPFEYTRDYVNSIISVPGLTADDVINFYNNLEQAMSELRPRKDGLIELMLYASGLGEIYMSPNSYINLQEKIVEATVVINNPDALLPDVTLAYTELETVIANIIVDRTELARLINLAESKHTLNYTAESIQTLKDILIDSKVVNSDLEANIDEIISAANSIIDGIEGLTVNSLELTALIESIELELEVDYNEKPANTYFTISTYEHILTVLAEAKEVDDAVKLEDYNIVLQKLKDAKSGLIVDKTELNLLVTESEKLNLNLYTANEASAFTTKLTAAKGVLSNDAATISQYLTALSELEVAISNLTFDITALENLRTQAETIINNAENYTAGSLADLTTAYNNSEEFDMENYVEICLDLEAKINATVSIEILKQKITTAQNIIDANMSDYEVQALKYYEVHFQRLLNAYNEATELVLNRYLPQEEVDRLVLELSFENYLVYIGDLKEVYNMAMLEDEDLYSRTSFARLKDALEQARLVLENNESKKETIDLAAMQIADALEGLEALMFTNQLQELYNDVKDYQQQDYTASTFRDFALYMLQAEAIVGNPEASQMAAMEVLNLLQDAISSLVWIKEFNDTIESFGLIKQIGYTLNSFQNFTVALNSAKETVKNENLTTEEVAQALATLQNAKGGLVIDKNQLQALYNRVRYYQQVEFTGDSDFANFKAKLANAQTALQSSITGDILIALINLNEAVFSLKVQDSSLIALFEFAKTINQTNYLFGFTEFVSKSTQIESEYIELEYISLEDYKTYFQELNALKNNLVYDNTLLLTLLAQANQIVTNQNDYSFRSVDSLKIQITYAQTFVPEFDDYELTCQTLQTAIENIVYLKDLRESLVFAKQFESDNIEDYFNNKLNYFEKGFSNLRNSIIETDSALRDSNITQQKVAELMLKLDINQNLISILPLREAIERAEGVEKNKYSAETYQNITNAIIFANNVTGDYNSTLDDVNQAIQEIDAAIENLALNVDEGQGLIEAFQALNPLHYESGYAELEIEINNLSSIIQALLNDQAVTIEEYTIAVNTVKTKQNLLVLNSKQELQNVLDDYNSKEYLYTIESFAEFKVFLQASMQKIENKTPMLVSEIADEILFINTKANNLVFKPSEEKTEISVIETNTTFKFYDSNMNVIDKANQVYNPEETLYLTNIAQGERITTILSQFENANLKVFDKSGKEILDLSKLRAATGQVISLYDDNGNIIDSVTVVVKGDVNGDGLVNVFDIVATSKLIVTLENGVQDSITADLNSDNKINVFDIVVQSLAVMGNDIYDDIRLGDKI